MEYARKILVTGGAGFIGSNYLNKYVPLYPDYFFINVDMLTYAGRLENIHVSKNSNYIFEKEDIRDIAMLQSVFKKHKPTDIIHFAAETHVDRSIDGPSIFVETNVIGTHNLLILALEHKIQRFLHVSTDEVYGSLAEADKPFNTSSLLSPNSPYSASKAGSDMLVRSYNKTYGLNTIITRCSNNYGPYQDESKLIPKAILNALRGKEIPVYGRGENIRDWIYVEDHIDALDTAFHKGLSGKVYNVGGNSEVRNIEIVKKLLSMLGKNESLIEFVADRKGHDFRYAIDNQEIEKELGWKPKINLEKGLARTVEFFKKANLDSAK